MRSFSGARTSPCARRAFTCSSTVFEQLPSMKSARCSSPFFRSSHKLPASPRLRLLEVVSREPRGSVIGSTFITALRAGMPQMLYLPSLSLISVVPSCMIMRTPGMPSSSGSWMWLPLQST